MHVLTKALRHVLASFVGIITPPLIIASALGLCMGIAAQPTLLSHLPKIIQTLFDLLSPAAALPPL